MRVEPFEGTAAEWDAFGAAQPGWTIFHRFAWRDVIGAVFGHPCPYLVARAPDGAIAGILPLAEVRSRLFGHYLVSMPFVSYGGPLGSEAAVRVLVARAVELARGGGADLLELRSAVPLPIDLPVSHRKLTVVLPLAEGAEATFKLLKSKLRSQVRRPQKEGVEMRFGHDQIPHFFRVFSRHMRDLGTPTLPARWFEALGAAFGDDLWVGCAWLGDQPIAGGVGFRWHDEFEITWASSLREYNNVSANMGLYWAFIERAAETGLKRFNFGRCSPDSPTHRFKAQWGALDEPLHWYQSGDGTAATPSPSSPKFALATRAWQRLPVPVATMLGPRIVRFIP